MSSILSLYNTFQLEDVREDTANNHKITELGQRAEAILNASGSRPQNWYEFKQKHAEKLDLRPDRAALKGGAIGLAIGAAFMAGAVILTVVSGGAMTLLPLLQLGMLAGSIGVLGSIIGHHSETQRENNFNKKLVNDYDAYLSAFEQSHAQTRGVESSINYRDDHAERLQKAAETALAHAR